MLEGDLLGLFHNSNHLNVFSGMGKGHGISLISSLSLFITNVGMVNQIEPSFIDFCRPADYSDEHQQTFYCHQLPDEQP
jgi:hypothetical protein